MVLRWLLAMAHLLALGIGLGAIWTRARALRAVAHGTDDPGALSRVLVADAWWGMAAVLWIVTGLWRLLAGTEKAPAYYYGNHVFWTKMALFGAVVVLELAPMLAIVQWRMALTRGREPDVSRAERWAWISHVQVVLVVLLLLAATAMARGLGT
jgi:putative membrane protein